MAEDDDNDDEDQDDDESESGSGSSSDKVNQKSSVSSKIDQHTAAPPPGPAGSTRAPPQVEKG